MICIILNVSYILWLHHRTAVFISIFYIILLTAALSVFLPPLTKPVLLFRLRRFLSTFFANSLRSDKLRKPKLCSPDSRISGWRSLAEEMTVSACKFIQVNTPDIFDDCLLPDYIQKCKQEPGEASVISHALIIAAGIV